MDHLHTTPASIAASLRHVADVLDGIADVELSPITVQVNLQAVRYRGTAEERIATVDALGMALVGCVGETDESIGDGGHHCLPHDRRAVGNIEVSVYTGVKDYRAGGNR